MRDARNALLLWKATAGYLNAEIRPRCFSPEEKRPLIVCLRTLSGVVHQTTSR
jgi:hypothetical protein